MEKRPLLLGHRGMGTGDGENSLLSLVRAVQIGADGVELDVHSTRDGVLVVTHDRDLNRTLGVDITIPESTYRALKKKGLFSPEKLTTLEKVYLELPDTAFINIEIKDPLAAPMAVPLVRSFSALDRTLFSSFYHGCLLEIRKQCNDAKIGLLIGEDARGKDPLAYFEELLSLYKPYSMNLPVQMFEEVGFKNGLEFIKLLRKTGIAVALWTLDDPDLLLKLKGEIDIVITDNLQGMMALTGGRISGKRG
jgi:glycerophosphoryl diester phosphodiesterase